MERTFTYTITKEYENMPINSYLKSLGYSSQNLVEIKKMPESVLLNGEWVYLNQRLHAEDTLTIHIQENASSEKIVPVELPLDIVYEDEDLMVVNKPADMPIHPSMNNYHNSLGNALAYYFAKQNIPFVFRCINRLDRDTSGLTIIAKHMVSAGMLSAMIAQKGISVASLLHTSPNVSTPTQENILHSVSALQDSCPPPYISREYLAIVRGSITPPQGTIDAPIARKPGSVLERQVDFAQGEHAITHYRVLNEQNGHSLVSLLLETGRTHQIRVHMKYLGHPLIGDYLYNPDMEHISRQALHSYRLRFTHPITHKLLEFTAPLPEDMGNIIPLAASSMHVPQ